MQTILPLYLLFFALNFSIALILAFSGLVRKSNGLLTHLGLVMAGVAGWTLSVAMDVSTEDNAERLIWRSLAVAVSMVLPVLLLRFCMIFVFGERRTWSLAWIALWGCAGLFSVFSLTNPLHRWLFGFDGAADVPAQITPAVQALLFFVFSGFAYLTVSIALLILIRAARSLHFSMRSQASWLAAGIALPLSLALLSELWLIPAGGWNLAPFGSMLSAGLLAWLVFAKGFLDILPVARDELLESIADGVVVVDSHERIAAINQTARRLIGGSPELKIGSVLDDVIARITHADSRIWILPDSRMEVMISAQPRRWLEMRVSVMQTGLGGRPGKLILLRDITDRREVEESSSRLATEYRFALEHMQTNVFRLRRTPEGDIVYVLNEGPLPQSMGQTTPTVTGKRIQEVMGDRLARLIRPFFEKAFHGEYVSYELEIGQAILLTLLSPVKAEGDIIEVAGSSIDVTERVRTEHALQQREVYLRSILDNFPYRAWLKSLDGEYLVVNHSFARDAGYYHPEEIRGKSDHDLWPEEQAQRVIRDHRAVVESGKGFSEENYLPGPEGRIWMEKEILPIFDDTGQVMGTVGFARDITRRKQAEQDLAEVLELNQKIISSSSLGILAYAEDGACVLANEAAARIVGATRGKLLQQNFRELESWKTSGLFEAALQALAQGEPVHRELRVLTSFEKDVWVDSHMMRFTSNGTAHLLLMLVDISDRKQSTEALLASEERFRNLVDSMEEVVYTLDTDQRHTGVFGRWVDRTGMTPEYFLGRNAREIFGAEQAVPHETAAQQALQGRYVVYQWSVHADDGVRYYSTSLSPQRDAEGKIVGLVGIGRDVTERMAMEREMENTKVLLESALEQTPIPMMLVSARDRRIRIINPACRTFLGIEKEPDYNGLLYEDLCRAKSWRDVDVQDEPVPPEELPLALALRGIVTQEKEFGVYRKDGQKRWSVVTALPIHNRAGEQIAAFSVFPDITKTKFSDVLLRVYASQLERSNRDLQDFASSASHDLQEPLRKIQAFGERLNTKYAHALDEDGRGYLSRMISASQRMQSMINALLDYSRVSTRAQPFVAVNLNEVLTETVSDLETRLEQTSGRVEIGSLPDIEADPLQIRLMAQNIIANALKFRAPERPPLVKIWSELQAQEVLLFFEDNGIGFDTKYLDKIFQPFQRLHGRGEYEGSGMGLAICRRILERHGGSITADSTPGTGTTFRIRLPLRQQKGARRHE